jgi:hypothetical protein
MMHHSDSIISIPFAAALLATPWWLPWVTEAIEKYHWLSAMLILPTLGIVIALLQIRYIIRKHKQLPPN